MRILLAAQSFDIASDERERMDRIAASLEGLGHDVQGLGHDVRLHTPKVWPPLLGHVGRRVHRGATLGKEVLLRKPDVALVFLDSIRPVLPLLFGTFRVPYAIDIPESTGEKLRRLDPSSPTFEAHKQLLRLLVLKTRAVVVHSREDEKQVRDWLGPQKTHYLPSPVNLEFFQLGERRRARHALGIPEALTVVTLTDSLDEELSIARLLEAHRGMSGTALLIAGEGPRLDFVRAAAMIARPSSPVLILESTSPIDRANAIRAADICVDAREARSSAGEIFAAMGRRQVALHAPQASEINALFSKQAAAFVPAEASAVSLRRALESALDVEKSLGPLSDDQVLGARSKLGYGRLAAHLGKVLEQCAFSS